MGAEGDVLRVRMTHDSLDDLHELQLRLALAPATSAAPPWSANLSSKGSPVRVSATGSYLDLAVSGSDGNPYEVTENDVRIAEQIELSIEAVSSRVVDPPVDSVRCISPAEYPEWFDSGPPAPSESASSSLTHVCDRVDFGQAGNATVVKFSGRCGRAVFGAGDAGYIRAILERILASGPKAVLIDFSSLECQETEVLPVPLPDKGGCLGERRVPASVVAGPSCAPAVSKHAFGRSADIPVDMVEWVYSSRAEAVESLRRRM
jgi:hypothetical protein